MCTRTGNGFSLARQRMQQHQQPPPKHSRPITFPVEALPSKIGPPQFYHVYNENFWCFHCCQANHCEPLLVMSDTSVEDPVVKMYCKNCIGWFIKEHTTDNLLPAFYARSAPS